MIAAFVRPLRPLRGAVRVRYEGPALAPVAAQAHRPDERAAIVAAVESRRAWEADVASWSAREASDLRAEAEEDARVELRDEPVRRPRRRPAPRRRVARAPTSRNPFLALFARLGVRP